MDPERIFLEPPPGDPSFGRTWATDCPWPDELGPPTEYVRLDVWSNVRIALARALETFRDYEKQHRDKARQIITMGGNPDRDDRLNKAQRNADLADMCDKALTASATTWLPMSMAPRPDKNAPPILVKFDHDADPYQDPADPTRLTPYAANAEGGDHLPGKGVCIAVWSPDREESEGWESGIVYTVPGWWFEFADGDCTERAVNPIGWLPLPE